MIGYAIDLIYLIFVIIYANKSIEKATKFLIIACFFQNFVLCIFSPYMEGISFSIFILLKEIFVLLYIIFRLVKKNWKINFFQAFCCVAILTLVMMTLFGKGTLKTRLSCLRQLYLIFVFYLFGSLSKIKMNAIRNIVQFYVSTCFVTSLFGFVEILLGNKLWMALHIFNYFEKKGTISIAGFFNGLPGNFYSYDIPFLIRVQRMSSFFVDPVICGQVLSLAFVISLFWSDLFKTRKKRYLYSFVLGIGLCMTLSKGAIIIAGFSFCILIGKISKHKMLSNLMISFGAVLIILYVTFSFSNEMSTATHMNGLFSGIRSVFEHPFGTGIGSAGNLAVGDGQNINIVGAESYVGSMLTQVGIVGLIFNLCYFSYIQNIKKKNLKKNFFDKNSTIVLTVNLALALTSLVNFTAISFTSCFMFIILAAMFHVVYNEEFYEMDNSKLTV